MTIIPDLETTLLMTIPFLVTYAALHFILFRPLYDYLQERDDAITKTLADAKDLDGVIEEQVGQLETKLSAARDEASDVRAEARAKAHEHETDILAEARKETEGKVAEAVAVIADEQVKASEVMRATATQLSTDIAGQILGREVQA